MSVVKLDESTLIRDIAGLRKHIKDPTAVAIVFTFTPALAAFLLDPKNNFPRPNRALRESKVRKYSSAMEKLIWKLTGESVKFSKSGKLMDGYHRLTSCVRANTPFTTLVVFNVDDNAPGDEGAPRGPADALTFAGYTRTNIRAAATRWHAILTSAAPYNRNLDLTNDDVVRLHNPMALDPMFDLSMAQGDKLYRSNKKFVQGPLIALLYIYNSHNPKAVEAFVADADVGRGNSGKLLSRLNELAAANLGRVHENSRNARLILTLNAYCTKTRLSGRGSKAGPYWDSDTPFPSFVFH